MKTLGSKKPENNSKLKAKTNHNRVISSGSSSQHTPQKAGNRASIYSDSPEKEINRELEDLKLENGVLRKNKANCEEFLTTLEKENKALEQQIREKNEQLNAYLLEQELTKEKHKKEKTNLEEEIQSYKEANTTLKEQLLNKEKENQLITQELLQSNKLLQDKNDQLHIIQEANDVLQKELQEHIHEAKESAEEYQNDIHAFDEHERQLVALVNKQTVQLQQYEQMLKANEHAHKSQKNREDSYDLTEGGIVHLKGSIVSTPEEKGPNTESLSREFAQLEESYYEDNNYNESKRSLDYQNPMETSLISYTLGKHEDYDRQNMQYNTDSEVFENRIGQDNEELKRSIEHIIGDHTRTRNHSLHNNKQASPDKQQNNPIYAEPSNYYTQQITPGKERTLIKSYSASTIKTSKGEHYPSSAQSISTAYTSNQGHSEKTIQIVNANSSTELKAKTNFFGLPVIVVAGGTALLVSGTVLAISTSSKKKKKKSVKPIQKKRKAIKTKDNTQEKPQNDSETQGSNDLQGHDKKTILAIQPQRAN